jgi:glycosyltransferase involved in cell wall biosynthesis
MKTSIAAVVLCYNEASVLHLTLPAIKASVDEVIVVDMGSTDGSFAMYGANLDEADRVVTYDQRNLPLFGFGHARTYGGKFATSDWILAIDSDEWIDPAQAQSLRSCLDGGHEVLELPRRNYMPGPGLSLDDLPALLAQAQFGPEEMQRRLYRNRPEIRWEGLIHEELCDNQGNTWGRTGRTDLLLHHLNRFKPDASTQRKELLYAYLILRAFMVPGFRYSTNPYWWTTYVRNHHRALVQFANSFAVTSGLSGYDATEVEKLVAEMIA